MNKKSIHLKIAAALICTTFLFGCGGNSTVQSENGGTDNNNSTSIVSTLKNSIVGVKEISTLIGEFVTYKDEDNYSDWQNESPNYIELKGTSAEIKGSGAEIKENIITITSAGVYVISGTLDDGQILIKEESKGTVRLVLNGAQITSKDSAAIYIKSAGKAIISLEEGTENTITDGSSYVFEDSSTDEPSAAIFSRSDLTINGSGKLIVNGNYNDGITGKDDVKITGGDIVIKAADDGLIGKDVAAVKAGSLTIEAGGDGIKSTNDTDLSKGLVAIEGGSFNITSGADGIQAETYVLISGGNFDITAGGGSANGEVKADEEMGPWGRGGKSTSTSTSTDETESQSKKGIKASGEIVIGGGTINIDSADDAIHSNNFYTATGGDITLTSGDDGIHADTAIAIKGGKTNITKSYEGIESSDMTISDGEIYITASDDGINISGGADGSSINGRMGQNPFTATDGKLIISGGFISVNADGDGLDSNGDIEMAGGTVVVSGPTNSGNGALDYNGTFEISGGLLVAAGSSGMAEAPSESSGQYSIMMTYPQVQQAGTLISLKDSSGKTLLTYAPEKNYQTVVISSPDLKKDSNYTLYSGGTSTGNETKGFYAKGENVNGTKVVAFTISSSVTWLNESGVTTNKGQGMGRPGGQGGQGKKRHGQTKWNKAWR
ncbi:carbohydrate-binding domain-containing protein [Clostridium thermarum]|uniref:carbohydrate-binding domain-containing protein n=1 Tax=Clostridium thermarum TaxID=1716543 RepID=UPI0011241534|nr:carbohydrate-binding domain-containing protein [Clostridium thermarum]